MDFWSAWCEAPLPDGETLARRLARGAANRFGYQNALDATNQTWVTITDRLHKSPRLLFPLPRPSVPELTKQPDFGPVQRFLFTTMERQKASALWYRDGHGGHFSPDDAGAPADIDGHDVHDWDSDIDPIRIGEYEAREAALGEDSDLAAWLRVVHRVRDGFDNEDVFDRVEDGPSCCLYLDIVIHLVTRVLGLTQPGEDRGAFTPPLLGLLRIDGAGVLTFRTPTKVVRRYAEDRVGAGEYPGDNAPRDFTIAFHHAFWRGFGVAHPDRPDPAAALSAWRMLRDMDQPDSRWADAASALLLDNWEAHHAAMMAIADPRPALRPGAPPLWPIDDELKAALPHHSRGQVLAQARRLRWILAVAGAGGTGRIVYPPTPFWCGS